VKITHAPLRCLGVALAVAFAVLLDVRAHAAAPAGRFTIAGSGATATATDNKTKLVWQQSVPLTKFAWAEAQTHCTGMGWRLPTMKELATLIDFAALGYYIDFSIFPGSPGDVYWSATAFTGPPVDGVRPSAWAVYFNYGFIALNDRTESHYVRCVR
jgi:hypothetical protein